MTFVFEARRLPFSSISEEAYSEAKTALVGDAAHQGLRVHCGSVVMQHVDSLPLWDRCMLLAVLPIVLDGRRQAQQGRHNHATTTDEENGMSDVATDGRNSATDTESGPVQASDPSATLDCCHDDASTRPPLHAASQVTVDDVVLAMKIVRALDELEVAWDHIRTVRGTSGGDADGKHQCRGAPRAVPLTEEELMMELLLAERGVPGFLRETCEEEDGDEGTSGDSARGQSADDVDIAMCFDVQGNSIGMGSAGVYGGHGFHLV